MCKIIKNKLLGPRNILVQGAWQVWDKTKEGGRSQRRSDILDIIALGLIVFLTPQTSTRPYKMGVKVTKHYD